jgi:hypothetical protein
MNEAIDLSNLEPYWQRRKSISKNSGTTIDTFKPVIPWQRRCLLDIRTKFDYSIGTHEILLSGSVGSAKSLFLAHSKPLPSIRRRVCWRVSFNFARLERHDF